jgi:hypothetical protein
MRRETQTWGTDMKSTLKLCTGVIFCAGLMFAAPLAEASETGLASIHALRHEHGRLCMAGHIHYGTSFGRSKSHAQAEAVKSWAMLVAVEYGTSWAHFGRAGARKLTCRKPGENWTCETEGRPCK